MRAKSAESAKSRVLSTLKSKGLPALSADQLGTVTCLPADLSQKSLGLDDQILEALRESLTTVIHSAWAVNFNLGVQSFESSHIRGTYNLLSSVSGDPGQSSRPVFFFCSSISAAAGTPLPARIRETYIPNLSHAQNMGYARSKMVTEHMNQVSDGESGNDRASPALRPDHRRYREGHLEHHRSSFP